MSRHPSADRSHEIRKTLHMKPGATLTDRLLLVVTKTPDCRIEDVVDHFPDLPWNEVFHAVTRLSRGGQLQLLIDGRGMLVRRRDEILAAPSSS